MALYGIAAASASVAASFAAAASFAGAGIRDGPLTVERALVFPEPDRALALPSREVCAGRLRAADVDGADFEVG
jgi:hypothetical protein